jgi:polyhydroxyalkanoate synthesis regulator phasin
MESNFIKKIINTGVGFVSLTAERMKQTVDGLISDGKISEEEGAKIVEDFTKNTETKREEIESQFKSIVEKVLKSFSFATKSDMENIENRIAVLEALLAKETETETETENEEKPKRSKKTAAKKEDETED